MKFTEGRGVHVVYDGVGASTWEKSMMCVRRRGMVIFATLITRPDDPDNTAILYNLLIDLIIIRWHSLATRRARFRP
jgi:NADPH:quinone reductase-like Zn-dependent oxidoreductase